MSSIISYKNVQNKCMAWLFQASPLILCTNALFAHSYFNRKTLHLHLHVSLVALQAWLIFDPLLWSGYRSISSPHSPTCLLFLSRYFLKEIENVFSVFLTSFSINLLALYHECHSLTDSTTHYLFCNRQPAAQQCALVHKMTAASWHFWSVCEEDLDKFLNH